MSGEENKPDPLMPVRLIINNAQPIAAARPADPKERLSSLPAPETTAAARGPNPKEERDDRPEPPARGGREWDGETFNSHGLPEGCPVTPLGIFGDVHYYLDDARQLRALTPRDHSRLGIVALFGRNGHLLWQFWPRITMRDDTPVTSGWKPELAAESLMKAAARKGVWKAAERERGMGAWRGHDGELVLHCGDQIYIGERGGAPGGWYSPGALGRYVYPADEASPRFAATPADPSGAVELLEILRTWNWRRKEGDVDAMLLLGWIGAAMIGGALDWRPLVWMTGGRGTGKSSLQKLIGYLFDNWMISVSDASAAGIWQKLGRRTLPVQFDELEAEEDNRKGLSIIKLARQASSGGVVLRGGSDHNGTEFVVQSCFLFSSIIIPPLLAQDRSRMAILELNKLPADAAPPTITPDRVRVIGLQLRRRLADGWHRLPATIERYRAALAAHGHDSRGADQFGTLLACADLLLFDQATESDSADIWAARLAASSLAEISDTGSDEERAVAHLLTKVVDPYRNGHRYALAEWIRQAADLAIEGGDGLAPDPAEANRILGTYGLKIEQLEARLYLVIANYHTELAGLYERSHWAGKSGTMGGWVQSWRRLPGACWDGDFNKTVYFAGHRSKGTFVPLEVILPDAEPRNVMARRRAGAEAAP